MNRMLYSNTDFSDIRGRINKEVLRRATYWWWDPLATPKVGVDRHCPESLPKGMDRVSVDDRTYTINTPSDGSVFETKNTQWEAIGDNPGGEEPNHYKLTPSTSAAAFTTDEIKNFLIGLSKIRDINLFYGRDEKPMTAFRDPLDIITTLEQAERDQRNEPLTEENSVKMDPNEGETRFYHPVPVPTPYQYPMKDGRYVMLSGESDGEEITSPTGQLGPDNFYDDYGAPIGEGGYHPYNHFMSAVVSRFRSGTGEHRDDSPIIRKEGGVPSLYYGPNPRDPNPGKPYDAVPVFQGKKGTCQVACTGLCSLTCDDICSESCTSTCHARCGEACTSSCGNVCTGCSSLCFSSCKTKCENHTGYACVNAGAKAIKISSSGGHDGIPARNHIEASYHKCDGCSYSCQFYPNKKTDCWDAGCAGKCFTSCASGCSETCYGGCIDNQSENKGDYKQGIGRGCMNGCTINCIGGCSGVCEGSCIDTCFMSCRQMCSDNCSWTCATDCGSGCFQGCKDGCTSCTDECDTSCTGEANALWRTCPETGCSAACQFGCDKNCMAEGCKNICGTEAAGACAANCRMNCSSTSCTSLCENACSGECTTCVGTCDMNCGACTASCSTGCSSDCNIRCSAACENSCEGSCITSCAGVCSGCSNLCFSCVGKCIGICSVKCEDGCSLCANMCSWWCDVQCNQACFGDCSTVCISTCSGCCITTVTSDAKMPGPDRGPTAQGYPWPEPKDRKEEQDSFQIWRDIQKLD